MPGKRLLLCTDMDGTVIPDGRYPEPPEARPAFAAFCATPHVTLAYVTGRDRGLVEKAISEYGLPLPDYALTDLGSIIYTARDGVWREWPAWNERLADDWEGRTGPEIARLLSDTPGLRMQEEEKQNVHKASFYFDAGTDIGSLRETVAQQIEALDLSCNSIWSVDPVSGSGLLDLLPISANKLFAIRFLRDELAFEKDEVLFAGDSGNDMQVFESSLPSIVVGNAAADVRQAAQQAVAQRGWTDRLYCAKQMYASGVLEGIRHFRPHETMEEEV